MLSTYPPTECGLATFARALVTAMSAPGTRLDVVRVVDEVPAVRPRGVVHDWLTGSPRSIDTAAAVLNAYDVVLVQHEFGIYGGPDGEELLGLLGRLQVPVVTVLHTVLARPTPRQRLVLDGVIAASDVLVTMTRTARDRIATVYGVAPDQVRVIPHGAPDGFADDACAEGASADDLRSGTAARPVILTWGLLGQGKGIEWAIEALGHLQDLRPRPVYVVAGRTHPRVMEREGDQYRDRLRAQAEVLGVSDDVRFVDHYLDPAELRRLVRGADVVLLPYDSVEQVTSGVLVEAVAAGRPVVSTRFPHAVELLSGTDSGGLGPGLLVERQSSQAIADAVRRLLTETGLADRLSRRAGELAPGLSWRAVAGRYHRIGDALHTASDVRHGPTHSAAVVA